MEVATTPVLRSTIFVSFPLSLANTLPTRSFKMPRKSERRKIPRLVKVSAGDALQLLQVVVWMNQNSSKLMMRVMSRSSDEYDSRFAWLGANDAQTVFIGD